MSPHPFFKQFPLGFHDRSALCAHVIGLLLRYHHSPSLKYDSLLPGRYPHDDQDHEQDADCRVHQTG
jgi:hypothetical protein